MTGQSSTSGLKMCGLVTQFMFKFLLESNQKVIAVKVKILPGKCKWSERV